MFVIDVWTGARASALRQSALRMSIEEFADTLGVAPRTVSNWEKDGDLVPRPEAQRILDTALEQLAPAARERFRMVVAAEASPADMIHRDEPDEVFSEADRAARFDLIRLNSRVGSETLEALSDGIAEIARAYNHRPLSSNFRDLQKLHTHSARLMDHTRRPVELNELFVVSSQAMALMASIAFDLGHWRTSERLIAIAKGYAEGAGNQTMQAWSLGLEATIAFWDDRPTDALEIVEHGLELAPPGTSRTRLRHIGARAAAVAGDETNAMSLLRAAVADQDVANGRHDPLHDAVGGEFAFGELRSAACEIAVFLALRDAKRVEVASRKVARALEEAPGHENRAAIARGARLDRAAAWILVGDIAAAELILTTILAGTGERKVSVTGRLATIRQLLSAQQSPSNKAAQRLGSSITEWLRSIDGVTPAS